MYGDKNIEKIKKFLIEEMEVKNIRFPETVSIGVKPVSKQRGTSRLVKAAFDEAIKQKENQLH